MTTVRLAHSGGGSGVAAEALSASHRSTKPGLLVAYPYLAGFLKSRRELGFRDWVLDSGAYTAWSLGKTIHLQDYIDTAKRLAKEDPALTEVFSLDVIGDWKAGLRNVEEMWKQGVQAIPCYHYGEPAHVLLELARTYPKIALGGVAGTRGEGMKPGPKLRWAQQCFARVWPKRIHGFSFGGQEYIMALPFHSVDASTWAQGPSAFGFWKAYGRIPLRGRINLRPEVDWYMRLEAKAKGKWGAALAKLDADSNAAAG